MKPRESTGETARKRNSVLGSVSERDVQIKIRMPEQYVKQELPNLMRMTGQTTYTGIFRLSMGLLKTVSTQMARNPECSLAFIDTEDVPVVRLVMPQLNTYRVWQSETGTTSNGYEKPSAKAAEGVEGN